MRSKKLAVSPLWLDSYEDGELENRSPNGRFIVACGVISLRDAVGDVKSLSTLTASETLKKLIGFREKLKVRQGGGTRCEQKS